MIMPDVLLISTLWTTSEQCMPASVRCPLQHHGCRPVAHGTCVALCILHLQCLLGWAEEAAYWHSVRASSLTVYPFALQVSDKFLNGHSNDQLAVIGVSIQKNPGPQMAKAALLMAAED